MSKQILLKLMIVFQNDFFGSGVLVVKEKVGGFPAVIFGKLGPDGLDTLCWLLFEDFVLGLTLAVQKT